MSVLRFDMHILLIHQAFASIKEPGGTRHYEIARDLVANGHKVTVITGQVSYLTGEATGKEGLVNHEVDEHGVKILRAYAYQEWHRSFLHRILSFVSFMFSSFAFGLRTKQVDVVWGTTPPLFQGLTAWILARLKRVPFLFEVRDLWPKFAVAVGVLQNSLLIKLSEGLERFLYRKADRVVINSPGFRDHVIDRGARFVELIPNGVDISMFPKGAGSESSTRWEKGFVVLYAGAHGVSNDLGVLLEAASILSDNKEIRLVLIGDGKEKNTLVEMSKEMALENVEFLPPVPKEDIPGVLASADACVAILKPIEAFKSTYPNKVFDYMAAGKPVVLAIDGVIRNVVEEAGAGVFVRPGNAGELADAVTELWGNPTDVKRMGRAGRKYVEEHFDRSKQVECLVTVLEELLP
jgi:glycosyltransferase involved in cell wall biosynthesis